MKVILRESVTEIEVKKSKFICHVKPVTDEDQAREFISEIKKEHRKATHNVPIYLIGQGFEIQKYSDDGEPAGTAGLPVLRMLMNEGLSDLVIVITRYFGGIKLGKGGLVRAYTAAAKHGLEASGLSEVLPLYFVVFELDYTVQNKFLHKLEKEFTYYEDSVEYSNSIKYSLFFKEEDIDAFEQTMIEFTSGAFRFLEKRRVDGVLLDGKIEEVKCPREF